MEVILKEKISNLGYRDDLVTVKDGYGRNFLIPQGKAVLATEAAKKMREETLKQRAHKEEKVKAEAQKAVDALKNTAVKVGAKVGENGKIFGSVTNVQLAEAIKKLGFDVDRKDITMKGDAIKQIGTYEADVKFHRDIKESISFEVVEE